MHGAKRISDFQKFKRKLNESNHRRAAAAVVYVANEAYCDNIEEGLEEEIFEWQRKQWR